MFRDKLENQGTHITRMASIYNINSDDEKMILGYLQGNKIKYECDTVVYLKGITSTDLNIAFEKESEYYFFIAFLLEQAKVKGEA